MARIRTLKPEFWTDEKIVTLSPLARLLFIGIWNFVDDFGRSEYSPIRLKMQVLPADSADISELLGEIRRNGLIVVYEVDGKEFFEVRNFTKHQKVDHRNPSKIPPPPISPEFHRISPLEGKGKEEEVKGKTPQNGVCPPPPRADIDRATEAWNETASRCGLARITKLTDTRRRQLGARLRSDGFEAWQGVLGKIEASPFLRGTNDRSWRVDFDFAISERGFTKIQEGKYNTRPPQRAAPNESNYFRDQYGEHLASIAGTWAAYDAAIAAAKKH